MEITMLDQGFWFFNDKVSVIEKNGVYVVKLDRAWLFLLHLICFFNTYSMLLDMFLLYFQTTATIYLWSKILEPRIEISSSIRD